MHRGLPIGEYLIARLYEHGVRHVFGIPGDYVLGFYDQLLHSKLKIINTCDEQGAGFAADAYARVRGLGAVCVTYCVGGLKVANTTAEAYAEKIHCCTTRCASSTRSRKSSSNSRSPPPFSAIRRLRSRKSIACSRRRC